MISYIVMFLRALWLSHCL